MNKSIFSPKLIVTCALLPVGLIYVNAVGVKATGQRQQLRSPIIPINASVPSLKTDTLKQTLFKLLRGHYNDKFIYREEQGELGFKIFRIERYEGVGLRPKAKSRIYQYDIPNNKYTQLKTNFNDLNIRGHFKITHREPKALNRSEILFVPKGNTVEIFEHNVNKGEDVLSFKNHYITTRDKFVAHFHDDDGRPTEQVFKITEYKEKVINDQASSSQMGVRITQEFKKNNGDIYCSYFEENRLDGNMVTRQWYPENSLEGGGYEMTEVRTDAHGNISGARYGVDGQLTKSIPPSLNVRALDFNKLRSVLTDEERR